MPSWVLSISKDGEPTNYLPGQCVSMLSHPHSKNSFLMFRGNLCFSLYPLSLILSLDTAFSLHPPFRHLYTLMRSLWALFSLRWTVPALPDLLQYLSQSQLPFAGLHPVVSFLLYWEAQNQSQKKKFKYSFLTIISSAGVRQIFSTMVQNDVLDHPFCTSSHLPPYWQPTLHRGNTSLLSQDWRYSCHSLRQSAVTTTEVLRAHMLTFRWWPQVQEDRAGRSPGLGCKKQLQTRVLTAEHACHCSGSSSVSLADL